jgi:hypothetical protein
VVTGFPYVAVLAAAQIVLLRAAGVVNLSLNAVALKKKHIHANASKASILASFAINVHLNVSAAPVLSNAIANVFAVNLFVDALWIMLLLTLA